MPTGQEYNLKISVIIYLIHKYKIIIFTFNEIDVNTCIDFSNCPSTFHLAMHAQIKCWGYRDRHVVCNLLIFLITVKQIMYICELFFQAWQLTGWWESRWQFGENLDSFNKCWKHHHVGMSVLQGSGSRGRNFASLKAKAYGDNFHAMNNNVFTYNLLSFAADHLLK